MKNLKILMAAVFLILALSACEKSVVLKSEIKLPPEAPKADLAKTCAEGNGNWLADFGECENVAKEWCEGKGGQFDECASACRHLPAQQFCTMQCVPVCLL